MPLTQNAIDSHIELLRERVFQVDTKWPHFAQLLRDLSRLADDTAPGATVVSLERTLLYGGCSLVAPIFDRQQVISIDCSPVSADERGAYNAAMVDDPRFIAVPTTRRASVEETGLNEAVADLVLVPNLVHHVADQLQLFSELARITKPGGRVYVFEPLVRELHQIPDDYLRYTPYGMEWMMRKCGLTPTGHECEGGPFSAIAYCWVQALQYLPEDERAEIEGWFYGEHFEQLLAWNERHRENLCRPHTRFPMSFSVTAEKR